MEPGPGANTERMIREQLASLSAFVSRSTLTFESDCLDYVGSIKRWSQRIVRHNREVVFRLGSQLADRVLRRVARIDVRVKRRLVLADAIEADLERLHHAAVESGNPLECHRRCSYVNDAQSERRVGFRRPREIDANCIVAKLIACDALVGAVVCTRNALYEKHRLEGDEIELLCLLD